MNLTEIFIIYLTFGAPFGVHYALKQPSPFLNLMIGLKASGVILFWFVYAFWLLSQKLRSADSVSRMFAFKVTSTAKVKTICLNLESSFFAFDKFKETKSFLDFRELINRYVGLTLAIQNSAIDSPAFKHESEIFRLTSRKKHESQLAARILHRKNFFKLKIHQIQAQQNLLRVIENLIAQLELKQDFNSLTLLQFKDNLMSLAVILEDFEFESALCIIFERNKTNQLNFAKFENRLEEGQAWNILHSTQPRKMQTTIARLKTTQSSD